MDNLPSSREEKIKAFDKGEDSGHWLYVHELRALLDKFKPTDWIEINRVGNIVILREGVKGFWVIDMSTGALEDFRREDTEDDSDQLKTGP